MRRRPPTAPPKGARRSWVPRPRPGQGIDWREVLRLAEDGVQGQDIAVCLEFAERVEKESAIRERLEAAVALGHARHRAAVARRMNNEAVLRGKATALSAEARHWLGYDAERPADGAPAEMGIAERLAAVLDRLMARKGEA